jgi:lipoprotein NlpD
MRARTAVLLVAAGCASRSPTHAPVEDRGTGMSRPVPGAVDPGNVKQLPGFENAGKPGYYTVKPGDTMIRIGLENGQNWRDIVRWNNLENPNIIEVGQVLRVVPPATESAVVTRPVAAGSAAASSTPAQAASAAKPASAPAAATASPRRRQRVTKTSPGSGRPKALWSRALTRPRTRAWT